MHRNPLLPAVLLLALFNSACLASRTGYQRASATADKTGAYRENLVRLRDQVGLTLASLRTLTENPSDSPRSTRETFQTFEREFANLAGLCLRSRRAYGSMDARAELFFGGWIEDSAALQDAELKKASSTRRAALQANYQKLAQGQLEIDEALEHFVDGLRDLAIYLEHDLTTAGFLSAHATLAKAFGDGAEIQEQLSQLAHQSDDARAGLAPLQAETRAAQPSAAQASADDALAPEEPRVR